MPLKKARKGAKKKTVNKIASKNIHELVHHGKKKRSMKQIIAIGIDAARGRKKKKK